MKDRWSQLSMSEKSDLMSLYIRNGVSSLEEIKKHYNSYTDGGRVDNNTDKDPVLKDRKPKANFYQRLLNPFRQTIPNWENRINGRNDVATHKIAWATDNDGNAIVYPDVQEINGRLYDFTDPRNKAKKWDALDRAIQTGDTIQMTPAQANFWTQHYKEFYPSFNYATGGSLPDWDPEHKHFHTQDDKKVVIDDSVLDIKANQDDNSSVYKETVNNARLLELANLHYEDMNSDEFKYEKNPEYDKAYQALISRRFGQNGNLATNYWDGKKYTVTPLPKGYYRNEDGVIMDAIGNYYTPYREIVNNKPNQIKRGDLANGFYNTERDPYGYDTEVFYEKVVLPSKYLYDKPIKPQNADYRLSYSDDPIRYYRTYPLVLPRNNLNKNIPVDTVKDDYDYFDKETNNLVRHKPNTPAPNFIGTVVSKQPYDTSLSEYKYYKQMEDAGYGNLIHTYSYTQPSGFTLLDVKNPQNSMYGLEAASKLYWLTLDKPSRRNKLLNNGVLVPEFNLLDRLH